MIDINMHNSSKGLYETIFNLISSDKDNLPINEIIDQSKERFFSLFSCSEDDKNKIVKRVKNEMFGLGILDELISDTSISEIMVNGYDKIYIEKEGKISKTNYSFFSKYTVTVRRRKAWPCERCLCDFSIL